MSDPLTGADSDADRIGSVFKAANIVDAVNDLEAATVTEVTAAVEMPRSTVHVYLESLREAGYLIREDGRYRLSMTFLEYGGELRQRQEVFQTAKSQVNALADRTGEVVDLGIEEGGKRVLIYKSEAEQGIYDNPPVGQHTHMHWTALGKALLAGLPDDRIEAIVDRHGTPAETERTITGREALFDEIETVRERGYSIEDEDRRKGIKGIGMPINDIDNGGVIGAVSVSGPRSRLNEERVAEEIVPALEDAVTIIELEYSYY